MPGCAAINCRNSAKKGFAMKRFPKDPKRRNEWLQKMRRGNWIPTDYSRLCEIHFAPNMWERFREDGKKKLRMDAVPTLFAFTQYKLKIKPTIEKIDYLKSQWLDAQEFCDSTETDKVLSFKEEEGRVDDVSTDISPPPAYITLVDISKILSSDQHSSNSPSISETSTDICKKFMRQRTDSSNIVGKTFKSNTKYREVNDGCKVEYDYE